MKKLILAILLAAILFTATACTVGNRQVGIDTVQSFDHFKIIFGDSTIEGKIKAWRDFDDSDVIQIVSTDGTVYLTHYRNVLMTRKP